jgi:hypothetical protein
MTTAMVVMEIDSEWPANIDDLTSVVGLSPCGPDILERTQEKLRALERQGRHIGLAVLACNAATDAATLDRRATLAQALLDAVRQAARGRLVLNAKKDASATVRLELLSLVGLLMDGLQGTTASVSLRFAETSGHGREARAVSARP